MQPLLNTGIKKTWGERAKPGITFCALGLFLAAAALAAAPSKAPSRVLDRVAAVVNDDVILLSEVDSRARAALAEIPSSLAADKQQEETKRIRRQALDQCIDDALIQQQVRQHQIVVTEQDVEGGIEQLKKDNRMDEAQFASALKMEGKTPADLKAEIRGQMERSKLIDVQMRNNPEMRTQVQVSERDVDDYYRTHHSSVERVRASHILFTIPAGADAAKKEAVRAKAQKVLEQIRGGMSFEQAAKDFSEDASASIGGDLGFFQRGDMVEAFEKVAFGMKKDQVSEPVLTPFGYHLIKVADRKTESNQPLEQVRGEIMQKLHRERFQKAMRSWLDDLKRAAYVDIKL